MALATDIQRQAAEPLADVLRSRTRALHRKAERGGIVAEILNGRIDRRGYQLLLRNLHPVYVALEEGLEAARDHPQVAPLAEPALYRTAAIEADIEILYGNDWRQGLPLLPAAEAYARRIDTARGEHAVRLIGHSYTRYLGDLNGGQVLRRLLARSLGIRFEGLSFYDFPALADLAGFRAGYREAFNAVSLSPAETEAVTEEAALAFRHNIVLSRAVQAARR